MSTQQRTLEHRSNNAYDTILLIESGVVIGNWTVGETGSELEHFANPGNLSNWETTEVDSTNPSDYGDLVTSK